MRICTIQLVLATSLSFATLAAAAEPSKIDFARQIRPILASKCFTCHGPDSTSREAGLRLDLREKATAELDSGETAIVPGKPEASELVRRINSHDADELMPPQETKKPLTATEKQLLTDWIASGAEYKLHWAFVAPIRAELPEVKNKSWPLNEIDRFILARLEAEQLDPSAVADKRTLIRRLSFDLRGLPPSIAEVEQFLADDSPAAYEHLVERLLNSPHFGEKLAQDWLDLARYGDTNGYHHDSHRDVWLYRDWLINAFNTKMPFDQFIVEQLAGDLLPNATPAQQIASGFNRNNTFNEEGGADPDEFYVSYAIDRANTTAQTFLGLTFGCAQCHDHKYDPITQREYYQFYAYFNSIDGEIGGGGENGHHNKPLPPLLKAASPLDEKQQSTTMVMKAMPVRKPAFFLNRGDFQQPGDEVEPGVPSIFPPLPTGQPNTRLGVAHWLVRKDHPLTSRVRVNHLWQMIYGTGIVRTAGDFGVQGELPSHAALLDWLAVEFVESGWDTKALVRKLVLSATYRQSSVVKGRTLPNDPYNRLLSRAPRYRLSAEEIRDTALATSGLLDDTLGGPSVRPVQPANYYSDKIGKKWHASEGTDRYRRGLYTYWRRTAPYPSFIIFDATSRSICTVTRMRTNTPLQALVTLNDPVFVEAGRVLGEKILREGGASTDDRVQYTFRRVLGRLPSAREAKVLGTIYERQHKVYTQNNSAAQQLIANGNQPAPKDLAPAELAAWTNAASVMLNLDEAITRE